MSDLDYMDAIEVGRELAPIEVIDRVVSPRAYVYRLLVPEPIVNPEHSYSWISWGGMIEAVDAIELIDPEELQPLDIAELDAEARAFGGAYVEVDPDGRMVHRPMMRGMYDPHRGPIGMVDFNPGRVPVNVAASNPDRLAKVPGESKAMRRIRRRQALRS